MDVDVGEWGLRLIAVHTPDTRTLDDIYELALFALEDVVKEGIAARRTNIVGDGCQRSSWQAYQSRLRLDC